MFLDKIPPIRTEGSLIRNLKGGTDQERSNVEAGKLSNLEEE